jgi:hypothetical protein
MMFGEVEPRHTKIEKVISVAGGQAILENHNGYPMGESNLYFLSKNGELAWSAERPAPDVYYTRVRLNDDGRTLSAYTTGMQACEIDIKSGKLLSKIEFK